MSLRPVDPALLARGSAEDPRLGARVVDSEIWDVAIVGCADETGVAASGGRTGAALGPTEIRRWFYKQTTGLSGELEELVIRDVGDVMPGASIEETHAELESVVVKLARTGRPIVFLGGGHDLAFATQSAVFSAVSGNGAILNLDTHLDVRPLKDGAIVTSGTPFRRLLERWPERVASLTALGIQPQHNARSHGAWLKSRRGRFVTLDELRQNPGVNERLKRELLAAIGPVAFATVSLDLDVAMASAAPGVSAPPADGLAAGELATFLELAGRQPKVRLLEVVEHAPMHDENAKTARLAALCLWRFLVGISSR